MGKREPELSFVGRHAEGGVSVGGRPSRVHHQRALTGLGLHLDARLNHLGGFANCLKGPRPRRSDCAGLGWPGQVSKNAQVMQRRAGRFLMRVLHCGGPAHLCAPCIMSGGFAGPTRRCQASTSLPFNSRPKQRSGSLSPFAQPLGAVAMGGSAPGRSSLCRAGGTAVRPPCSKGMSESGMRAEAMLLSERIITCQQFALWF